MASKLKIRVNGLVHSVNATLDTPFNPADTNGIAMGTGYWMSKNRATNDPTANPNPDLNVPSVERPALDQIIAELRLKKENPEAALRAVNGWFQNNFRYSMWQEPPHPGSKTNPLQRDTDKDGVPDGREDQNHNGRVDKGETNPNGPDG